MFPGRRNLSIIPSGITAQLEFVARARNGDETVELVVEDNVEDLLPAEVTLAARQRAQKAVDYHNFERLGGYEDGRVEAVAIGGVDGRAVNLDAIRGGEDGNVWMHLVDRALEHACREYFSTKTTVLRCLRRSSSSTKTT